MGELSVIPLCGIGEITPETDFAAEIAAALYPRRLSCRDVLVVSSKAVSKWEGGLKREADIAVSDRARELSVLTGSSPGYCQAVLDDSVKIVRLAKGLIISRTRHGFVMANAGVDASNTGEPAAVIPLPSDPDASAARLRGDLMERTGEAPVVIVSDTFGRAWRNGQTNLAVGVAGMLPLLDYRGTTDSNGRLMKKTVIAVADELASAADLVAGKTDRVPAVLIRGYPFQPGEGGIGALIMEESRDLFP